MNGPAWRKVLTDAWCSALKRNYSSNSEVIQIPKRIHRGPTDILRALAKTHKRDSLAAHYKYHDDPYLTPYSNSDKRKYALSLEAGRKAAHWIRQEHSDLFNHSVADPTVELFIPSKMYKEDSDVSVDDLKDTISKFLVSDSITVYNMLLKKGIELNGDLKQSLLELLCFYNCEEGIDEQWLEERWFRATQKKKELVKKTWKDNGLAEELFKSINPATPEAYSSIITGMAKYGQAEGAMKLFEEAKAANISLSIRVYNTLISRVAFLRESHELMWKLLLDLMDGLKSSGLKPNLGTFNSALETLSLMSTNRNSRKLALQVLAEMKNLNIKPSLATFFHLINLYYSGSQNSGILHDIMDYVEQNKFSVSDINDCMFFVTAMEMCRHKLHEVSLGYRINQYLNSDENYKFIGDSFRESLYYRYFFTLLCEGEPLDVFMKLYDEIVPHLYTPEPSVMMDVLNSIEVNMGFSYLPKLWTDMVLFDLNSRQNLLIKVLELMNQSEDPQLQKQFVNIAWSIWEKIEGQVRQRNVIEWTGGMLSDLMKLLVKNDSLPKASLVFDKLYRSQNELSGEPDMETLRLYVSACLRQGSIDSAIKCVRYCQDMGFNEAVEFAGLIESSSSASEQQIQRLNSIMGRAPTGSS